MKRVTIILSKNMRMENVRISYDLTGENSLTLDEDLAGLDRAYNKRLANLAGYIVCQQTNDGSKFFQTTNMKKNTSRTKRIYRYCGIHDGESTKKIFRNA